MTAPGENWGEVRFRLRGWRAAGPANFEQQGNDAAALKARVVGLLRDGYRRLDLEHWNLELSDWVRLERWEG